MGVIRPKPLRPEEQFFCDDFKLQLTLGMLADKYTQQIRELIYRTYDDNRLHAIYDRIRNSGIYQHGSKDKSKRKILEIPNPYVMDFITTVLSPRYGKRWFENNDALHESLVRPWWVVKRL